MKKKLLSVVVGLGLLSAPQEAKAINNLQLAAIAAASITTGIVVTKSTGKICKGIKWAWNLTSPDTKKYALMGLVSVGCFTMGLKAVGGGKDLPDCIPDYSEKVGRFGAEITK